MAQRKDNYFSLCIFLPSNIETTNNNERLSLVCQFSPKLVSVTALLMSCAENLLQMYILDFACVGIILISKSHVSGA